MRNLMMALASTLAMTLFAWAAAQGFNGTFVDPQSGLVLSFIEDHGGGLRGGFTDPNGEFALQGGFSGEVAWGWIYMDQGVMEFQALLHCDEQLIRFALFEKVANSPAVQAGPSVTLIRYDFGRAPSQAQ